MNFFVPIFIGSFVDSPSIIDHQFEVLVVIN